MQYIVKVSLSFLSYSVHTCCYRLYACIMTFQYLTAICMYYDISIPDSFMYILAIGYVPITFLGIMYTYNITRYFQVSQLPDIDRICTYNISRYHSYLTLMVADISCKVRPMKVHGIVPIIPMYMLLFKSCRLNPLSLVRAM